MPQRAAVVQPDGQRPARVRDGERVAGGLGERSARGFRSEGAGGENLGGPEAGHRIGDPGAGFLDRHRVQNVVPNRIFRKIEPDLA